VEQVPLGVMVTSDAAPVTGFAGGAVPVQAIVGAVMVYGVFRVLSSPVIAIVGVTKLIAANVVGPVAAPVAYG
jgi:xanthine/uracil permease